MAHMYQRTAALSDDEDDDEHFEDPSSVMVARSSAPAACAPPPGSSYSDRSMAARSGKFSYANKQQKDMRRKAKEWFSSA